MWRGFIQAIMIYKYIRFSTNSQDERQQEHTIDSWLESRGMVADNIIRDEGISGGTSYKNRNLFGLVKGLALNDTLIVSEISRITRSGFGELNELIQGYFKPHKLRLVICNVGLDLNCARIDTMTEMQLSMWSIIAKREKELLVGRTKLSMNVRKELKRTNGGWESKSGNWTTGFGRRKGVSGPPMSKAVNLAISKRMASDTDRKRQWLLIQELRTKGETMEGIASTMNAVGELTPRGTKWSSGSIYRALNKWNEYFLETK